MFQSPKGYSRNHFLRLLLRNESLALLILGIGMSSGWAQEKDVIAGGRQLFQKFCASCHGTQAKGDGPLSESLKPKPANLTRLSANYGMSFPFWYAYRTIDGRDHIPSHGTRDMPVFGIWFRIPDDEVSIETEWATKSEGESGNCCRTWNPFKSHKDNGEGSDRPIDTTSLHPFR